MKNLCNCLIALTLVCICSIKASAQIEIENTVSSKLRNDVGMYVFYEDSLSKNKTLCADFEYNQHIPGNCLEAFIGLTDTLANWLLIGGMGGFEVATPGPGPKLKGILEVFHKKFSLIAHYEKGINSYDFDFKNTLSYKCSKKITLGINYWRYTGLGSSLTCFFFKGNTVSLWLMPSYDFDDKQPKITFGMSTHLK